MSEPKEELKHKAYKFAVKLTKFISALPNNRMYWVIGDQLLRSGTSIGSNIIEAQAASSRRDFINYYQISLKSANETKFWLCLLRDSTDAEKNKLGALLKETCDLANILGASLLTLKNERKF